MTTEQRPDQLSPWQTKAAQVPEQYDLALTGGRAGGKTHLLLTLLLRHCEQFKKAAKCLIVRKTFPALMDLEAEIHAYLYSVYGDQYRFEGQKHRFTLPGGGTIQLDQLENETDFQKYQGKSFTLIAIDEAGQYASPALPDRLRSSLRAPHGIPTRFIILANPGGAGHHWLFKRYASKTSWAPYPDPATGSQFVTVNSTYKDNPYIDRERYAKNLMASCSTDPELAKAWLNGDWSIIRGAYFSSVIDEARNMIEPWKELPPKTRFDPLGHCEYGYHDPWEYYLAHDFGVSAPSVTYLCAESPGAPYQGQFYPRGSIILVDEFASCHQDDHTKGLGFTVPDLADRIRSMCEQWGAPAVGTADDAIFNRTGGQQGTIAAEFRAHGVIFQKANKGSRLRGWEKMRQMLQAAGQPDVPGLYISRLCRHWWETVPHLPRDPRRHEDVDSSAADHAADATRYALTKYQRPSIKVTNAQDRVWI